MFHQEILINIQTIIEINYDNFLGEKKQEYYKITKDRYRWRKAEKGNILYTVNQGIRIPNGEGVKKFKEFGTNIMNDNYFVVRPFENSDSSLSLDKDTLTPQKLYKLMSLMLMKHTDFQPKYYDSVRDMDTPLLDESVHNVPDPRT